MVLQALLGCRKGQDNCLGSTVGLFYSLYPQRGSFLLFFHADNVTILHQALGILQSRGSSILCQVCLDMLQQFQYSFGQAIITYNRLWDLYFSSRVPNVSNKHKRWKRVW